jgi:hypothetical protein
VSPLDTAGIALTVCAVAAAITRRIPWYQLEGLIAVAEFLYALAGLAAGDFVGALACGGVGAWYAVRWWRGGGGDDTKRRLRRLRRAFTPVRRTAPATT